MPDRIVVDRRGILQVLQTYDEVRREVNALAQKTAASARAHPSVEKRGAEVVVDDYDTDRQATSVTIKHPGARGMEAKHGVLTRAAAEAGLEVRSRP